MGDEECIGLDQSSMENIITVFLKGRGDDGATEEEIEKVVDWANKAYFDHLLVRLVAGGSAYVGWKNDEVIFWKPESSKCILK